MPEIKKSLTAAQAYNRLSARAAAAECAPADFVRKMHDWGLSEEETAQVMQRLTAEKFVDERRFALAFVKDKLTYARWGRQKIAQALRQKGIGKPLADEALATIDEEQYASTLRELMAAKGRTVKGRSAYERRIKLIRFGLSRGFEQHLCCDTAARIVPEGDEEDF